MTYHIQKKAPVMYLSGGIPLEYTTETVTENEFFNKLKDHLGADLWGSNEANIREYLTVGGRLIEYDGIKYLVTGSQELPNALNEDPNRSDGG